MGLRIKLLKNTLGIIGFGMVIALSFFIISDVEKTFVAPRHTTVVQVAEYIAAPTPAPLIRYPAMPEPVYDDDMYEDEHEVMDEGNPLPKWLHIGLDNYTNGGEDASPLSNEDLAVWLRQGEGGVAFGDAWFVPSLRPRGVTDEEILNASYTLVRRWSQAGKLYDLIELAHEDTRAFKQDFSAYIAALTGEAAGLDMHIMYHGGDFEVLSSNGSYIFMDDGHLWTQERIISFVEYMDAAIEFVRYRFTMGNTDNIRVTLYPFGVVNIPDAIAEMADAFEWDAPNVNFVSGDEITLAGTARFGPWAISHEVAHILLFREFPMYRPPIWVCEGMAMLGEMLFRDEFEGTRPYRVNVPLVSNIDNLARRGDGHTLPLDDGYEDFGRNSWTYDDAGSFVLYLYRRFGIEALLQMFTSDNYSQFDMAHDIFGRELEELMNSWREFLWPDGEPDGWWIR